MPKGICYNASRQERRKCSLWHANSPGGRNSGAFLFRCGKVAYSLGWLPPIYNDSAQKTPAVRKNVRGMNAPITNNATIIPTGFSSGIVGFSWPDVLQNAVIRCIALLFQEKHFR